MAVGARHLILAATLAVGAAVGGACSDDADDPSPVTGGAPTSERTTYDDVAELATALDAGGLDCPLEYEGLTDSGKELSLCTISGEQATITIWFDPARVDAFLAGVDASGPGATAVGANWTVDVVSVELATDIAEVLGGTVVG